MQPVSLEVWAQCPECGALLYSRCEDRNWRDTAIQCPVCGTLVDAAYLTN